MKRRPNVPSRVAVAAIANAWMAFSRAWLSDEWWRRLLYHLQRQDLSRAVESVPNPADIEPERFQALFQLVLNAFASAYERSANDEYESLGSIVRVGKRLHLVKAKKPNSRPNRFVEVPHSDSFIRERAARLVVEISAVQRQQIRDSIQRRYRPDVRPEALVRDIKAVVGLDTRLANAVQRRADELRTQGMKPAKVQQATQVYADQLLQHRAEMIARTETAAVETDAKQAAWEVAAADGLVDRPLQEWVANAEACADCQAMDGDKILVGEQFFSHQYGFVKGPPLHPHCACGVELAT